MAKKGHRIEAGIEVAERVGVGTYYGPQSKIVYYGEKPMVYIGAYCSIANCATIFGSEQNHIMDRVSTYPFLKPTNLNRMSPKRGTTTIENDVWLGYNSTITAGILVANGSIVGINSVVTKDVPPYCIVAGNPARIIRQRFTDKQIEKLLKIAWWTWDEKKINSFISFLTSNNIDDFIRRAEQS